MSSPAHNPSPLYRRVLGDPFDRLPPLLRRFHEQAPEACAQGVLRITRGSGWFRQMPATLLRMPSPGKEIPVTLQVKTVGDEEYWTRDFGGLRLATRQWLQNGLLMELSGPIRFGFRLEADAREMRFECVRCWFMGIPLPAALSPRITAASSAYEDGWWLHVRIAAPLLGILTEYEGKVTLSC